MARPSLAFRRHDGFSLWAITWSEYKPPDRRFPLLQAIPIPALFGLEPESRDGGLAEMHLLARKIFLP
jgi:hypothetical protein